MDTSKPTSSSSSSTSPHAKKAKPDKIVAPTIGSQRFQDIVGSSAFVDKTMLIQEIVNAKDKGVLITCPRRFGKSTNLDMLKTFLEIEVDNKGKEVQDKSQTANYRLFENLAIAKNQDFMKQHFGKYPVIFVDFKNVSCNNTDRIMEGVKTALHEAFMQHKELYKELLKIEIIEYNEINGENYPTEGKDVNFLIKVINSKDIPLSDDVKQFAKFYANNGQDATHRDVIFGLKFLSRLLYQHFKRKTYILVDEYDAPVHGAIHNNIDPKWANDLMEEILKVAMKGNDKYLEHGMLTGISSMVRGSAESGINNMIECQFLQDSNNFVQYYGFTENEVLKLLEDFNISIDMQEQMEKWYNGYYVQVKDLKIYNPYSILRCIRDIVLQSIKDNNCQGYWQKSGSINNILDIFKVNDIRTKIEQLIQGQDLQFAFEKLKTGFTIENVQQLQTMLNARDDKIKPENIDLFFCYIFELGYLSPTQEKDLYKIPNEEIKQEFRQNIVDYYLDTYTLSKDDLNEAIKQLDLLLCNIGKEDTLGFEQSLNKLFARINVAKISNSGQLGIHQNEDLYHSIINVIAVQSKSEKSGTEIYTHKETEKEDKIEKGRIDTLLINNEANLGIIIEIKYNRSVDEALRQAQEYKLPGDYPNVKKIKCIGINIDTDKKVTVKYAPKANINYNKDPSSGEGLSAKNDLYKLSYHKSFNKYHSGNIAEILQLRIKKLSIDKEILILHDTEYQLTESCTGAEKILRDLISLNLKDRETSLLPYNIENKHWVGLMAVQNDGELQVRYVDPENNPIPEMLLLDLQSQANKLNIKVNVSQIIVEQQKYNNCGPEVIENFILLLTGSRLTQEKTVPFHSQLVEDDLLKSTNLSDCNVEVLEGNDKCNIRYN